LGPLLLVAEVARERADAGRRQGMTPLTEVGTAAALADEPYHEVLEEAGDEAVLRLRVPHSARPAQVVLRYVRDAEANAAPAELDAETDSETWWRATVSTGASPTRCRWLLSGGEVGYGWVNGLG